VEFMSPQLDLPHTVRLHPDELTDQERAETLAMLEREAVKREKREREGKKR
jgi:hypothetical protein